MAAKRTNRIPPFNQLNPEPGEIYIFSDKLLYKFITEIKVITEVVNTLLLYLNIALR